MNVSIASPTPTNLNVPRFADTLREALQVPVDCQSVGCSTRLPEGITGAGLLPTLQRRVLDAPLRALSLATETGVQTALAIPHARTPSQILWWTSDDWPLARLSAQHAQSLLELHSLRQAHQVQQTETESLREENQSLFSEVQSLVHQVANDFEEISLIRSLATNLQLSAEPQTRQQVAEGTLEKLTEGLTARSVAILFTDEQQHFGEHWWTADEALSVSQLHALVRQYEAQAMNMPVVKNDCLSSADCDTGDVSELILLECRSRDRLHAWVLACDCTEVETVAWAQAGFTTEEASLAETIVGQLAAQFHNLDLLRQKEALFTDVIRALVNAVEARDPYTCGHSERVARFARHLAHLDGHSTAHCEQIFLTGLLHDVGKIAIPDGVLQKPSQLDEDERKIIETHTEAGWRILHELDALSEVLPGVLYHHERFDGKGYPDGLAGTDIPLDGRILAVCDAFDAMTSNRPYRNGMEVQRAAEILRGGSGTHWDPDLITLFTDAIEQFDEIRQHYERRQVPQREKRS